MEPLPIAAPSCALSDPELREQLRRYRVVGDGAEVLEWTARRRTIRVAQSVPEPVIERVMQVEEPALDALTQALGVAQPLRSRPDVEPER